MFFFQIGEYAKANKTKISIIGLEGEELNMKKISQAASLTSGTVNILNPLELMRQLRLISQNPVVATNVNVKAILHQSLHFNHTQVGWGTLIKDTQIRNVSVCNHRNVIGNKIVTEAFIR